MKQEDKDLLLRDLCARLPYNVQGVTLEGIVSPLIVKGEADWDIITSLNYRIVKYGWKPYLRPMSSMTEEEHRELSRLLDDDKLLTGDPAKTVCLHCGVVIDFHNSHHLDWRGLISKGLALKAHEGMYKIE